MKVAVQQRSQLKQRRPVRRHISARRGASDLRPHAPQLGKGAIRLSRGREPAALEGIATLGPAQRVERGEEAVCWEGCGGERLGK